MRHVDVIWLTEVQYYVAVSSHVGWLWLASASGVFTVS